MVNQVIPRVDAIQLLLCELLNTCSIHGTQENPAFILPLCEINTGVTGMTLLKYMKYYLLYIVYIKKLSI